jgi:hypothetical protein
MINPDHIRNLRPTEAELDQCHLVTIADSAFGMRVMKTWCWENRLSLMWSELVDTSDVDYTYDHVAGFWFIDEKDATVFTLKFK